MKVFINEKLEMSIIPENKKDDKKIRDFYKKHKGSPIEKVIEFNVFKS